MKYNLLVNGENEGILESILDAANGKLVIASDNSFVISAIVKELREAALDGGFELYNGSIKVNPVIDSEVRIVAICTNGSKPHVSTLLDRDFKVAYLTRKSNDSFIFDIEVKDINVCEEFILVGGVQNTTFVKVSTNKDIVNAIKSHNIVFVQELSDEVIDDIKLTRQDTTIFSNVSSFSGDYVLTGSDGIILTRFDAPGVDTVAYRDSLFFMSNALKYSVNIVCNTTWVKFFLELTSMKDDIELSSVVIYNSPNYGVMGNESLYTKEDI